MSTTEKYFTELSATEILHLGTIFFMFYGDMHIQITCILKQHMKERNMSNLCFVATCTFKMSILLYSKTAHEG